jgi:hypothetical protein
MVSAEWAKFGWSDSIAAAKGSAAAPVLRKLRRLSTRNTLWHLSNRPEISQLADTLKSAPP